MAQESDEFDLTPPITVKENPKLSEISVVNGRGENLFAEGLPEHPEWLRRHFAKLAFALNSYADLLEALEWTTAHLWTLFQQRNGGEGAMTEEEAAIYDRAREAITKATGHDSSQE